MEDTSRQLPRVMFNRKLEDAGVEGLTGDEVQEITIPVETTTLAVQLQQGDDIVLNIRFRRGVLGEEEERKTVKMAVV